MTALADWPALRTNADTAGGVKAEISVGAVPPWVLAI